MITIPFNTVLLLYSVCVAIDSTDTQYYTSNNIITILTNVACRSSYIDHVVLVLFTISRVGSNVMHLKQNECRQGRVLGSRYWSRHTLQVNSSSIRC